MFNKDFYPTPKHVVEMMCMGFDFNGKKVLEPSAGSGNIVEHLKDLGANVTVCESNRDLARICSAKADRFLKDDFLQVTKEEVSHIDYIIMNPPFSADEKHILHAESIAKDGCIIISLCNSETLNKYSYRDRLTLTELIKNIGTSEYLGDVFSEAERKTNVNVSLIKLYKPKLESEDEFDGYFDLSEEYQNEENGIMRYNEIVDIVNRYVGAVKKYSSVIDAANEVNALIKPINDRYNEIKFGAYQRRNQHDYYISRDEFKKELQKSAWKSIFDKMKMNQYVTRSVMQDINKFVENQVQVPFTVSNVYKMIEMIVGTHKSRMEKVLVEAFEKICGWSAENSEAKESWKTNSNYKINKKFIHPYITEIAWGGNVGIHYGSSEYINDIMKALCYISGRNYNEMRTLTDFARDLNMKFGQWYCWGFFEIRGYKKGTMHFKFQDVKLWEEFNLRVAKIKGWELPKKTDNKTKGTERQKSTELELFTY